MTEAAELQPLWAENRTADEASIYLKHESSLNFSSIHITVQLFQRVHLFFYARIKGFFSTELLAFCNSIGRLFPSRFLEHTNHACFWGAF